MKQQTVYDRMHNRIKPETRRYVRKNLAVIAEISRLMKEKGWNQKDLAKKMGKTESEVSKWLSGLHNLTMKSIAKLETVLDADLLEVPQVATQHISTVHYAVLKIEKPFHSRPLGVSENEEQTRFDGVNSSPSSMVA